MDNTQPLCDLQTGQRAQVCSVHHPTLRRRLMDLGLVAGRWVTCVGHSPSGDPAAYEVCGAVVAIRRADAQHITVRKKGRDSDGAD